MALWLSFIVALSIGFRFGGRKSLSFARSDELARANRCLQRGAIIAAVSAVAMTSATLGWPFVSETKSESYEVTKRIAESVEVPVQVTWWFFWTVTEMRIQEVPKDIVETHFRETTVSRFSFWMMAPLGFVALSAYFAELWLVHFVWRWRG